MVVAVGVMMMAPAPIWFAISWIFARRQHLHPISGNEIDCILSV
jgi:hypothetical protein